MLPQQGFLEIQAHQIARCSTIPPFTWLTVGINPLLLKCSSVSGSTTNSQVSSPPFLMKATTSACRMPSMLTPLTWKTHTHTQKKGCFCLKESCFYMLFFNFSIQAYDSFKLNFLIVSYTVNSTLYFGLNTC